MSDSGKYMATLENELTWFCQRLEGRLTAYFEGKTFVPEAAPALEKSGSPYAQLVLDQGFSEAERLVLMLALAPHLKPQSLDSLLTQNPTLNSGFSEFGGYKGKHHQGFLPTGETAVFLLSGDDLTERAEAIDLLAAAGRLLQSEVVILEAGEGNEPRLSHPLTVSQRFTEYLISGKPFRPAFSEFPARRIETTLEWEDLVVDDYVKEELELISCWMTHEGYIMNELGLKKNIKPGYRALFYGPPGTGKTLTACLLGKASGYDVYRIDLSNLVSKYIGETEKNLARIFDYAEKNKWILFFDEADAIFGKRTQTNSSNDRFANQEVAYLLQKIEDFPGIVILASNLKSNMDEAFSRRFQSEVYFAMPEAAARLRLWENIFDGQLKPEPDIDLKELAEKYELSGGSAINIFRHAALKATRRQERVVKKPDILQGIRRELLKQGKTI